MRVLALGAGPPFRYFPIQLKLSVGVTGDPEILETEGLFTQGS
jgi:hypothetical protein